MWWRRRTHEGPLTAQERRDESISAYLDDELSEAERAEIEALFAENSDARDALDDLRLLTSALNSMGEVRAPRSFAIPAPAAGGVMRSGVFRRMELGIRASAAVAALFFVVALVNQPGAMSVGTSAQDTSISIESAPPSGEALRASDGAFAAGASALAAPESTAIAGGEPQPTPGPSDVPANAGGGVDAPAPEPAGERSALTDNTTTEDGAAKAAEAVSDSDEAFGGAIMGTSGNPAASDGVGGVAPALATLAILLTVLSVLVAWGRRSGSTGRQ
jgi:anti-sigma factor RsiW